MIWTVDRQNTWSLKMKSWWLVRSYDELWGIFSTLLRIIVFYILNAQVLSVSCPYKGLRNSWCVRQNTINEQLNPWLREVLCIPDWKLEECMVAFPVTPARWDAQALQSTYKILKQNGMPIPELIYWLSNLCICICSRKNHEFPVIWQNIDHGKEELMNESFRIVWQLHILKSKLVTGQCWPHFGM